jgi:hypothetical protein
VPADQYLVENSRPRRVVKLFGRVLASRISSTRNRAGQMWLDEGQFSSVQVQRLLLQKRLTVITRPASSPKPAKAAPVVEAVAPPQSDPKTSEEVAAVSPPEPVVEAVPAEEPAVVEEPEEEPATEEEEVPADEPEAEESSDDEPGLVAYSKEDLSAMKLFELRILADQHSISKVGRKAILIDRILEEFDS